MITVILDVISIILLIAVIIIGIKKK